MCFQQGLMLQQWTRDILGVPYVHQRQDRDKYVIVRKDNVEEEKLKYFDIVESNLENLSYDFGSILHPPYHVNLTLYRANYFIFW